MMMIYDLRLFALLIYLVKLLETPLNFSLQSEDLNYDFGIILVTCIDKNMYITSFIRLADI